VDGWMGAAASHAGGADKAAGTFYCVLTCGALECKTLASQGTQSLINTRFLIFSSALVHFFSQD